MYVWTSPTEDDLQSILTSINDLFKVNQNFFLPWPKDGNWDPYFLGSYLVDGLVEPAHKYTKELDRITYKNTEFSKRRARGDIVVAPFRSSFKIELTVPPASEDTADYRGSRYAMAEEILGSVPDPSASKQRCFRVNGVTYAEARLLLPIVRVTRNYIESPCDYDPDEHLERIASRILGKKPEPTIVQAALAEANKGQYEILATLAELPEGWLDALKGCKTILRIVQEAREKDFRIRNKIKKLRAIENPSLQVRTDIKNLLDAVADVYLTMRLAIEPTVAAIFDWLNLNTNPDLPIYHRFRETFQGTLDIGFNKETLIPVVERAFVKRRYEAFIASLGWGIGSALWELVPMSWIIDRYMELGNLITAHTSSNLSVDQGATYSWKYDSGGSIDICQRTVSVSVHGYIRTVVDPSRYCGITYPPKRSLVQHADHSALAWKIFLGDLFTSKRKGT